MRPQYVEHDDVVGVVREYSVHLAACTPAAQSLISIRICCSSFRGTAKVPTGSGTRVDLDGDAVTDDG